MKPALSVVLITLNEASKIEECLRSVAFAQERIVVDAGSSDGTKTMAEKCGAKVYERAFDDFSSQKNFGIEKATGDWLLLIDADERVTAALQEEIKTAISASDSLDGYFLRRSNVIFGRRMRFGAGWNDRQLRLLRRGKGKFSGAVHERVEVTGRVGLLRGELVHYTTQTIEDYLKRLNLYTELEARICYQKNRRPTHFHLFVKPIAEFLYYYVGRFGFLDGYEGLQFQILSAFYTYVKYARALELFSTAKPKDPKDVMHE